MKRIFLCAGNTKKTEEKYYIFSVSHVFLRLGCWLHVLLEVLRLLCRTGIVAPAREENRLSHFTYSHNFSGAVI